MSNAAPLDPVALTADLIRLPSVTPRDEGAMDLVERHLTQLGFTIQRLKFGEIENLYARRGTAGRNLCFAGHTDVVPPGDAAAWACDPFAAEVADGVLIGRGAADMKGGIAAFLAAVSRLPDHPGSLSFLITGDEEGAAIDGTKRVVEWLAAKGERIDHCLVGEPTSVSALGDMIKIGRRGSLNATFTVRGRQGHVAYPHRAANPIPVLIDLLATLKAMPLDNGYEGFQPSNLELTTVDVGNPATNVIPAEASARLNIRFNPAHTGAQLVERLTGAVDAAQAQSGLEIALDARISGEAFLTRPDTFVDDLVSAVESVTGLEPELSTTGGTSDARFIRALCPVVEFGLPGATMHQVNEAVRVADLERLADIYEALIRRYGAARA